VQVSGSLPRFGFITAESDEARKSATVAIPVPLCLIVFCSIKAPKIGKNILSLDINTSANG